MHKCKDCDEVTESMSMRSKDLFMKRKDHINVFIVMIKNLKIFIINIQILVHDQRKPYKFDLCNCSTL